VRACARIRREPLGLARRWVAGPLLLASAAVACGGGQRGGGDEDRASFDCNDRMVGYVAHGTMAAPEVGVAVDCAERGPRLVRWRVESDGTRAEDARGMTTGEFDALWRKIEGTGWRDLGDCNASGFDAPTYMFSFRTAEQASSCECQHTEPPYPYHAILRELDALAARGKQLGPDDIAPDEIAPKGKPR
jgi:hypothetical protein